MASCGSSIGEFFFNGIYTGDTDDEYFDGGLSTYRGYNNGTPPPITGILDPDLLSPLQSPQETPAVTSGLLLPQLATPTDSAKGKGKTVPKPTFPLPENSNPNNSPLGLVDTKMPTPPSSETASAEPWGLASTTTIDQLVTRAQLQARDDQINQMFQKLEEENRILRNMQNMLQTSIDNLHASFGVPSTTFLNPSQWTQSQVRNIAGQQLDMQQNISAQAGSGSFPPPVIAGLMGPPPQVPGPAPKRRKGNKENPNPSSSPALSPNTMARRLARLSPHISSASSYGAPQNGTGSMPFCSPEVFRKFQQLTSLIKKKQETVAQYKDKVPANFQANFNNEFKTLWSSVGKDDAETIKKLIMYHNTRTPSASPRTPLAPVAIQMNGSSPIQTIPSSNSESFVELLQDPFQLQNHYPTQLQFPGNNQQEQSIACPTLHMFGTMNGQVHTPPPQNNVLGGSGYMQGYQFHEQGQTMLQQMHSPYSQGSRKPGGKRKKVVEDEEHIPGQ